MTQDYEKLSNLINDISELMNLPRFSAEFKTWKAKVERTLKQIWPNENSYLEQFSKITYSYTTSISTYETNYARQEREKAQKTRFLKELNEAKLLLTSFLDEIPNIKESSSDVSSETDQEKGTDVFIVHGHDTESLYLVKDVVAKLQLNPIILHEQEDRGKTIIEKLETHSQKVDYAIILLTPDDIGYPKDKEYEKKPRSRQNVILELGLFIGLIGRENVAVIHKEVEIPSDYSGVLFIPMKDEWKLKLAKEMKASGLDIDLNKLV